MGCFYLGPMLCTQCKKSDTKVIDSRDDQKTVRRRRECLLCGFRFTTYERLETPRIKVRKRDGHVESYDRQKIEGGICKALEKRPVSEEEVANLIDDIEHEIILINQKVIPSIQIGEIVTKKLKKVDEVAYLRFISVYKSFSSAKSFASEAQKLVSSKTRKLIRRAR